MNIATIAKNKTQQKPENVGAKASTTPATDVAIPTTRTKMSSRHLEVFYGDKQALFGIDLDVPECAVTALIGPSGCGKSTFLRCLNRMNDTIDGLVV